MATNRTTRYFVLPFLAAFAAAVLIGALLPSLTLTDDSYITYRYARNLAEGNGPVWNPGERVEGYTCFLHMVLCAGAIRLGIDPGRFSQVLGLLALALIAALGYRRFRGHAVFPAVLFAAYVATNPAFLAWAYSGMETVLFCAFLFSAVIALESEFRRETLPVWTSILVLLAALTRPEGMMLGLVTGICLLVFSKERRWKNAAVYAAICGLPFVIYFAWRYSYFGHFYPNTYYAKIGHMNPAIIRRGIGYLFKCMLVFLFPFYVFWQVFSVAAKWKKLSLGTRLWIIFFLIFSFQVVLSGGDFMAYARFYLPVLPLAALVLLDLHLFRKSQRAEPEITAHPSSVKKWFLLAAALFALNIVNPLILLNHVKHRIAINLTQGWAEQGRLLGEQTPPDTELATAGIGAIGWYSDRTLVDIIGLTDAEIAHNDVPIGRGWPGHESHHTDYLLSRKPDILLICNILSEQPWKRCYCEFSQRFRIPAVKDLFAHPDFQQDYVFANLEFSGRYLSAYLRRDRLGTPGYERWAPSEDADRPCGDKQALMEEFRKLVPGGKRVP